VNGSNPLPQEHRGTLAAAGCRRAWALAGREYSYSELAEMASQARPFAAVIDPDAFLEPGGMPEKIAAFCASMARPLQRARRK